MNYIPFILFTVLTNAGAQLLLKQGANSLGELDIFAGNPIVRILQIAFNPWVFFALVSFVVSMATHIYVLTKVELSFAYPFLSLAYVIVVLFAFFVFHETLGGWRIAGITLICVGTILVAQSGREVSATVIPQHDAGDDGHVD
ncbi:EamA family transporter [Hoeflea sp. WL0058]|uniref:EamA family transporter n=1 Tax=Flavimaribacter sediminis TaxID=2865987 RepID=A0AAE3CZQ5_9HYPH|nr:EamA family transporter [Flavimaribacter sediminis]MBW8635961.1 EamA family transporter [Flavimaribacter sediminis]